MLNIKNLYIKNLKCIDELEINFSEKINLITGDNGKGKSSIIDAIQICLLPNSIRNLQEYIKDGEEKMKVSLDFIWNKHKIKSTVSVDRTGKKEVHLRINDKENISKKTEVYKVLKELGLDTEIFLNSCLSRQHESTFLLTRNKSTQISLIKSLFDLSKIEKVNSFLKEKSKIYKIKYEDSLSKIKDLQIAKEGLEKSLKENFNIPEIMEKNKFKKLEKLLKKLENKLIKLREIKENNLKYYDYEKKILEKKSVISILIKEKSTYHSQTRNLEKLKLLVKKVENHKNFIDLKYKEYKDKVLNLRSNFEKYNLKKSMSAVYFKLKKDKIEKEKEFESLKLSILELEKDYQKYNELSEDFENLEKMEKEYLDKLKLLEQKICPTCHREFSNPEEEKKNISNKIEELKSVKQKLLTVLTNLTSSKQKYEEYSNRIKSKEISIIEINKNINSFLKEFNEIKVDKALIKNNKYKDIEKIRDSYFSKLKKYEGKITFLNEKIKEKEILKEKVQDLKTKVKFEIQSLKVLEKAKPTSLKKEFFFNENRFNKLKDLYNNEVNKIKLKEMKEKALEDSLKSLRKISDKVEEVKKESENYIGLSRRLNEVYKISSLDFSFWILGEYISEITNYCNKLFSKVYPKYNISIDILEDSSLEINLTNNYNGNKINSKLSSGFELQLLALVLRKAFSNYYSFNVLILDEADESASENNSELLFDLILKRSNFQVIYISHKLYLKDIQGVNRIDL